MIERYLDDLEQRLLPEVEQDLWDQWETFLRGEWPEPIFRPGRRKGSPAGCAWPAIGVNEALDDPEKMALQQLKPCSDAVAAAGPQLLAVRCNYGTGIMPTLFGADLFVMDPELNTLPTSIPIPGGPATMEALVTAGVPEIGAGLGRSVMDMADTYLELFDGYPNIQRYVHVYHPDLQGPMDVVELLWGSSLFLDIVDRPDLVKSVLELVTETYAAFMCAWEERVPPRRGDVSVHWAMMQPGRIMLRDDSAMNFSPEMFDEFIRPYDAELLRRLGGGAIHFCGRGDHYIRSAASIDGLLAMNLSQPSYNDMETIYSATVDRGIPLLGLDRSTAEQALARGRDLHHRVHCW
jgi:hypothetical protein